MTPESTFDTHTRPVCGGGGRARARWSTGALSAVALLAWLGSACTVNLNTHGVAAQETRRFSVSGPPEIAVETFAGPVEVRGWDRQEVAIEIDRRAVDQSLLDEITVEATQQGDRVTLRVNGPSRYPGGLTVGVSLPPRATLRVAMPRDGTIDAFSRRGSVTAEGVSGALTLRSDDGSLRGNRLSGRLHLRTRDGSIRLERIEGTLDAETLDGRVVVDGRFSLLRVRTSDGSIRAVIDEGSRLDEDWEIATGDGSVTLRLPSALDAELRASTRDGRIRSEHDAVRLDDRRTREVHATLGAGGRTLTVHTGDGSIRFER
jgi:hypothetical protein